MVQKENIELEIILNLIRSKTHLREIARSINKPHSTVLRKINKLFKEGILDYKREGKNKTFFIKNNLKTKNYLYLAEIYKLNKILEKHPELSIIFEDIIKKVPNEMIILFGSYAKGNEKSDSDIDIFVETKKEKIKKEIKEIDSRLSIKIGNFDLNSLLIKEIIKNHIIIKGVEKYYGKNNFFEKT